RAPRWARQWQFWLTLAVGGFLRLYWLGRSPFYSDSALLYVEVARAAHDHLLPGTGIYNSLLALNMPFYTLLLYPFANDPQAATWLQALANVAAVALLYIWAERAFGRWAALAGGLLFATALYDTYNSGYIWQQCLLLPVLVGALFTLHLGVVERRRHWFIPHALLLAAAIQLHPIMIFLLPLTLVGLAAGWKAVTWYDFYLGVAGALALYVPTMLFEVATNFSDLPIYLAYFSLPRITDGQTLQQISAALGPRPWNWLGADTSYAAVARALAEFEPVMDALVVTSLAWLAALVVWTPARALWRRVVAERATSAPLARSAKERERQWRVWWTRTLTLGAPLMFVALTLRRASPVYVHYAFVATPPLYVAVGAFLAGAPGQVARLARWVRRLIPRLPPSPERAASAADAGKQAAWAQALGSGLGRVGVTRAELARLLRAAPGGAMMALAGVLIVSQAALTGAYTLTFARGGSPASTWGGVPTTSYEAAMAAAQRVAARLGAGEVFLAGDPGDPFMGLYWAQRGNNLAGRAGSPEWTAYGADACALTPPAGARPAPTLVMDSSGLAIQALLSAPGTRVLQRLDLARDATYPLVAVAPNPAGLAGARLGVLNGELRLDRAFILPASGGLPARLVTRWTALRSTSPGPAVAIYHLRFQFQTAQSGTQTVVTTCAPGSWVAGEGAVAVTPLPAGARMDVAPSVRVTRETHSWWRPRIGAVTLETAKELIFARVLLPRSLIYGPGVTRPTNADNAAATLALPLASGW
ncbi:MAG TPA: hypothetical protein VF808_06775, partial [Ktedonobacterales bacterium]